MLSQWVVSQINQLADAVHSQAMDDPPSRHNPRRYLCLPCAAFRHDVTELVRKELG